MRWCLFDGRNPEAFTKADRQRRADIAIVSHRWPYNPFGMTPGIEVGPSVQPGILYFDGKPSDPTGYNGRLAKRMETIPEYDRLNGRLLPIWVSSDGRQQLWAFDLTNLAVNEAWRLEMVMSFGWANLIHFDYATNLAWLRPDAEYPQDKAYWRAWDTAYAFVIYSLSFKHTVAQQFKATALAKYATDLFIEEAPTHTGQSYNDIRQTLSTGEIGAILELRYPLGRDADAVADCLAFAEEMGCAVSWGRDSAALVGRPG